MYSGVQAGNLAALVGAIVLVLGYFNISIPAEDVQTLLGAALIIAGPIFSYFTELKRGATTVIGTFKSPV